MIDTMKNIVDFLGGIDIIYTILICLAATQLWKMLLDSFGRLDIRAVRPFPYLAGSFVGLAMVEFSTRGVLIGVVCGMVSSIGFFGVVAWLDREASPSWQKAIAKRVQLK